MLRRLAITLGDPAGIGPEVILKALATDFFRKNCEITVIGSGWVLQQTYEKLREINGTIANPESLNILDINGEISRSDIELGVGSASSGAASFAYLETAIAATLKGEFHGIVTGPIAKTNWKAAGHDYPGQTELLAVRSQVNRYGMLFVARSPHSNWTLRTLLATTHIPLSEVSKTLTPQLLDLKLDLLIECLNQDFGIKNPKIAISGLNPHSGENGQLGTEEKDWLIPWIEQKRHGYAQIQLDGPIPPDTLWVKPGQAWYGNNLNTHDAYVALYHDQGLIPVKLMAFDRAVNTTIGLPFIRTSPDHGTAFDIVGQGIADASSFQAAIALAMELAHQRYS